MWLNPLSFNHIAARAKVLRHRHLQSRAIAQRKQFLHHPFAIALFPYHPGTIMFFQSSSKYFCSGSERLLIQNPDFQVLKFNSWKCLKLLITFRTALGRNNNALIQEQIC
jgi:hypothetical protein